MKLLPIVILVYYYVASRSTKRVSVDAADAAKALDRQKVAKPSEQQTPVNPGITAREEAAKPEPETLLAVEATPDVDAGNDLDGVELSGADLAAECASLLRKVLAQRKTV